MLFSPIFIITELLTLQHVLSGFSYKKYFSCLLVVYVFFVYFFLFFSLLVFVSCSKRFTALVIFTLLFHVIGLYKSSLEDRS